MEELDDIEQLRRAALLTLHQKKPEVRPQGHSLVTYPEKTHLRTISSGFDDPDPISAYTNSVQLSPRSAAFVESNISILKRRKEGLDDDRWSRSPSPKYKPLKRKSLSPIRRASPERKIQKRSSRSPVHVRSGHSTRHRQGSSRERERGRDRDRDRVERRRNTHHNGERDHQRPSAQGVERNRSRHRSRSKSPSKRVTESSRHRMRSVERSERNTTVDTKRGEREEKDTMEKKSNRGEPIEKMDEDQGNSSENNNTNDEDDGGNSSDSDQSEVSPSEAIDLFASEDSESENEGRFKCSSKPSEKEKSSFSSKTAKKTDLTNSVLPDGDGKGEGRFGDRPRRFPRGDGHRNRDRGAFKPLRDNGKGSSEKHHRRNRDERRGSKERDNERERMSSTVRRVTNGRGGSSEKL